MQQAQATVGVLVTLALESVERRRGQRMSCRSLLLLQQVQELAWFEEVVQECRAYHVTGLGLGAVNSAMERMMCGRALGSSFSAMFKAT